jgi:hypothetical protein
MGRGDDAHFECRGSGAACPPSAPENESACDNPDDGPGLECPYPDRTNCRCMGESWRCMAPPDEPGAGGAPNGPGGEAGGPDGPGGPGAGGRPDGPMPP